MSDMAIEINKKVRAILCALTMDRVERLGGVPNESGAFVKIAEAMRDEGQLKAGNDIAFHVLDWVSDAAFLVAAFLRSERFSVEEFKFGLTNLFIHAPNHLAAAASLAGYPIQNVFGIKNLIDQAEWNPASLPSQEREEHENENQ